MNKVYLLFLLSLFTLVSWGQTLKNNFVVGVQLPFLYNNDRKKPDDNSSSSAFISFRPCVNIYLQADRYDVEQYGRLSNLVQEWITLFYKPSKTRITTAYDYIHQVSFLYVLGGKHKKCST